ncbi:MAG: Bug family tripartite tricarboxylate transporter substrate binding protein [Xanthobacteraceae bacterium]
MAPETLRFGARMMLWALGVIFALSWGQAQAQTWPQRPVKIIVPLGPGAGVDITARLLGDQLGARWGQSVVIDNRPGGDGAVAMTAFTAAQDDHTLLMSPTSSFTHHPWLYDKLPYDPLDLVPIARVSNTIVAIVVPSSSPIHSLADLVTMARAEPGKLNWATITGFFDFMFEAFLKKANLQMARVPYRNTVQAANDLAEGRIHVMMAAYAIIRPLVDSGKLRILAFTARERAAAAPDVPTAAEAGEPDLSIDGLVGLFGPRNLPGGTADRIATDVRDLLTDSTIVSRLTATGQVVNFGTAAEFSAAIDLQRTQAAEAGKLLGKNPAQ